ncbi:response regulator transcription factor [Paenibacillus woosongensis]|uniref:Response regulator transcription factor n=1 Tax=Paenibacillus woosongensis TaxID=307580 RepID=A0AA95I2L9_9BACL|nr:response regulator transcription factor [Paenibacillus woosongensis]WHX47581.1 response regulator transcription factor [Paenibacillus woosongensis]
MSQPHILLVDDEKAILKLLHTVLAKEGYTDVDSVGSAEEAIEACRSKPYDLILLDVMLPGKSGFEAAPFIREMTDAPILFLTARSTDLDKLTGFAIGGDDYIVKPFNPLEVIARLRVHLRRTAGSGSSASLPAKRTGTQEIYDFGYFVVDGTAKELTVNGRAVDCPAQVFQLLLFLCRHPNRVFPKDELYERVWGESAISDDNTVMVHIHRIRERIEPNPAKPVFLVTVRGLGYKLVRRGTES